MPSYFVSDDVKVELLRKQQILLTPYNPELYPDQPDAIEHYHDLIPIDEPTGMQSSTYGCASTVYKGTNSKTGEVFCLRRIHNFQHNQANIKSLNATIENWKKVQHANIAVLRNVFMTKMFGDLSLMLVYDYFPGAQTLNNQYFAHAISHGIGGMNGLGPARGPFSQQKANRKLLPEQLIWSYIIQLSSALRTIHSSGLACRSFDPTKVRLAERVDAYANPLCSPQIILTNGFLPDPSNVTNNHLQQQQLLQPRLRLSGCAVFDISECRDAVVPVTNYACSQLHLKHS